MNRDVKILENGIEMIDSLMKSIDDAGGCIMIWEELKDMTALELVSYLATNKIKFYYEGEYINTVSDIDKILDIIDREIEHFKKSKLYIRKINSFDSGFEKGMKHIKNLVEVMKTSK